MEYPKSNVRLRFGDFSFVPRDDSLFAIFIYLQPVPRHRSTFYAAFAKSLVSSPCIDLLPVVFALGRPALTGIQCYKANDLHIAGNVEERISDSEREAAEKVINDTSVGCVHTVWGYRAIPRLANEITPA